MRAILVVVMYPAVSATAQSLVAILQVEQLCELLRKGMLDTLEWSCAYECIHKIVWEGENTNVE